MAISVVALPFFSLAQGTTTALQQVPVTFYSSVSFLKSAIPGEKHAKFSGRIMDVSRRALMPEAGNKAGNGGTYRLRVYSAVPAVT